MNDLTSLLSPKTFAEALGVSASSVKRWADTGLIDVTRTAGGHRRIVLADAIRFLRSHRMKLVYPERLGLTGLDDDAIPPAGRDPDGSMLVAAIQSGDSDNVSSILTAAFLQGSTAADLWDGPIATALEFLGEKWQTDDSGIPIEHEGTMALVDAPARIKSLMPASSNDALTALGGAPSGDPYLLPNLAASAVLIESGFNVVNLGPDTPSAAFIDAVRRHQPELVWLSLTSKRSDREAAEIDQLLEALRPSVRQIVLGGRFALSHRRRWTGNTRVLETMNNLALVADTLNASR